MDLGARGQGRLGLGAQQALDPAMEGVILAAGDDRGAVRVFRDQPRGGGVARRNQTDRAAAEQDFGARGEGGAVGAFRQMLGDPGAAAEREVDGLGHGPLAGGGDHRLAGAGVDADADPPRPPVDRQT